MFTDNFFLNFFIGLVVFIVIFRLESLFEKLFRIADTKDEVVFIETDSLIFFKNGLRVLCFVGSSEISNKTFEASIFTLVSLIAISVGVLLRIIAITTLKEFWSFNVKIYKNHTIVKSGVYHYLRHPAYLGNIYISGIFLLSSAYITTCISLGLIIIFGIWRSNLENKLIYIPHDTEGYIQNS